MKLWERVGRRQAEITGLMPVARLRRRLADLEPALEENARLALDLERQVADLELRVGELAHRRLTGQSEETSENDPENDLEDVADADS